MDPKEQFKKGISAIDLGNCTGVIKEYHNISKGESLYILNIESKKNESEKSEKNDNSFNLGKDNQIEVYDKSGQKLDLSVCKEDIKVMKYIGDTKELDINSAISLANQSIDVFNTNDDFFNDICHDFNNTDGKDIIINDRRKDIYQNATFCQSGCTYSGMNYELMAANCLCDSSILQINSNNNNTNNINNNNEEENITFKTVTKLFIANLFNFNLDVFKCYNLVLNLKILKGNIGFYCMAIMFILQIIFLFVFLIKRLNPLKNFMLFFHNNKRNSSIYFSPPKIKKKIHFDYDKNHELSNSGRKMQLIDSNDNGKEIYLNLKNNNSKIKNSKFPDIKSKRKSKDLNSIHNLMKKTKDGKLIYTNNISPIINIQTPIININNIKRMNKKKISKNLLMETTNNKNKFYKKKSNKNLFFQNNKNKKAKFFLFYRNK